MIKTEELALDGGPKVHDIPAPVWPVFTDEDVNRVTAAVQSGVWSWVGPEERAFSEEYAAFNNAKYCACMANGTVTLQCALQAVGVVPGDEVIVPGLTWVATAQAAMDIGAQVVLVDIDPATYCIDTDRIEEAITPRTKAIIPVHLYGCMPDMDALMAIARKHNLKVVEDVAHQQGGAWRGQRAGTIGDVGSCSFQQSKIITSGEGGAVLCNDKEVYQAMFALKQVGHMPADPDAAPFDNLVPGNRYGHNYRITEMQAALLRGGLQRLPEQNARREETAQILCDGFARIGGPLSVLARDERVTTQAIYALSCRFDVHAAEGVTREQFCAAVTAEGMPVNAPYPPVHKSPLLNLYDSTSPIPFRDSAVTQDYKNLQLPVTEDVSYRSGVLMGHTHLLGDDEYTEGMLAAYEKTVANLDAVKQYFKDK